MLGLNKKISLSNDLLELGVMTIEQLTYLHLLTIVPCLFIGGYLLLWPKGTPVHRSLGITYMLLMLVTAFITLAMPAEISPFLFNHFGPIHGFSFMVLFSVPKAYIAVKNNNIRVHKINMIALYIGGILIAGLFTLAPGRMIHGWIFG